MQNFVLQCSRVASNDPSVFILTPKYLEQHPGLQMQGPAPMRGCCWYLFKAGVALLPAPRVALGVCSLLDPADCPACAGWDRDGHWGPTLTYSGQELPGKGLLSTHIQPEALESKDDRAQCCQLLCSPGKGALHGSPFSVQSMDPKTGGYTRSGRALSFFSSST